MKVVGLHEADLNLCVQDAQHERVVLTRRGKPVAVLVGVEGLDLEQLELGHSDTFWKLIQERRQQSTISRAELEQRLASESTGTTGKRAKKGKKGYGEDNHDLPDRGTTASTAAERRRHAAAGG